LRLKDLLGPVTRVKKKKKHLRRRGEVSSYIFTCCIRGDNIGDPPLKLPESRHAVRRDIYIYIPRRASAVPSRIRRCVRPVRPLARC